MSQKIVELKVSLIHNKWVRRFVIVLTLPLMVALCFLLGGIQWSVNCVGSAITVWKLPSGAPSDE